MGFKICFLLTERYEKIVVAAVSNDGNALHDASDSLKNDKDVFFLSWWHCFEVSCI